MTSPRPIFLFANRAYGAPFLETAAGDARRTGRRWTIVLSARRRKGGPGTLSERARSEWRRLWLALKQRARVLIVEDVNSREFLATLPPDAEGVVSGFNQIFRADAIERFRTLVNFHPSLLPCYRGPTPSHWVLARGEPATGFTLHRVEPKIDAGEILAQEALSTTGMADADRLDEAIARLAQATFLRWILSLDTGDEFERTWVDARSVYRRPADYLSFPPRATDRSG